jgi:hypothetical protein
MAADAAFREARQVGIGDANRFFYLTGKRPETGAEHYGDTWRQPAESADQNVRSRRHFNMSPAKP